MTAKQALYLEEPWFTIDGFYGPNDDFEGAVIYAVDYLVENKIKFTAKEVREIVKEIME